MGVTPPTAPSAKHQSLHDKLSREHGARFDRQFAREMVKDHRKDIAEYQKEAKSKRPLAQFAQETIPTLQKHLRTAQSIESKGAMTGSKAGAK
jgi:putative membrane protein